MMIIKVYNDKGRSTEREWHIPKVIPLKLFLVMAPSSSEDVSRAMRIVRNYLKQNWREMGRVI